MKTINTNTAKTAELVAFYNANSGKPAIKKFSDRATAEKRVAELLKTLKPTATKSSPAERVAENRARRIKIIVPVEETGKRSLAKKRYAMYKNGMTVGEYVKAGGKLRDVAYDLRVGFIAAE